MSRGYNCKADIWSIGITALELAYGSAPFSKYPPMKVIYLTLSSNEPPTLDRKKTKYPYSKSLKELVDACLQRDPAKRPSAESLLKHSFFKKAKKKNYIAGFLASLTPIQVRELAGSHLSNAAGKGSEDLAKHSVLLKDQSPADSWNFSEARMEAASTSLDDFRRKTATSDDDPSDNDLNSRTQGAVRKSRFILSDDDAPSSLLSQDSTTKTSHPDSSTASEIRLGRFSVFNNFSRENGSVGSQPIPITLPVGILQRQPSRMGKLSVDLTACTIQPPGSTMPTPVFGKYLLEIEGKTSLLSSNEFLAVRHCDLEALIESNNSLLSTLEDQNRIQQQPQHAFRLIAQLENLLRRVIIQ